MTKELARQAIAQWKELATIQPNEPEYLMNYSACLFTVGEYDEAMRLIDYAYTLDTASAPISMNRAMFLKDLGKFAESSECVQHSFVADADNFYLRLGYTESLLRNGNWRDAWPLYDEARPGTKQGARNMMRLGENIQLWTGQKLVAPENKLLVIGEGGTGDRVTYSRWLPMLDKLGIEWSYFPDNNPAIPGLLSLFERVPWLQGKIVKWGDKYELSHWTTVFSLPAAFEAIPTQIPEFPSPFLPDPELKKKYAISSKDGKPIYGLIWGANELFEGGMKFRSLLESQAMRLVLSTADLCHWVNCWMGDTHGTNFKLGHPVYNPKFENWEDTAALLSNMDGIVTTDNGAGWLAQALGLPTSVLLSGNSDWKFLRGSEKSYWHKKSRLIRNDGQGFENAVDKLIKAIRNGEGVGRGNHQLGGPASQG